LTAISSFSFQQREKITLVEGLAVLGNKDLIPSIEPLLKHPEPAVQKDALDAIATLRSKS